MNNSRVADFDWRPTGTTGTSRLQVTITNPASLAIYPVCRVTATATKPVRQKTLTWAGSRRIGAGAAETYELEISKVPISLDSSGYPLLNVVDIACRGVTSKPANAVGDASMKLDTTTVRATATLPVNSRSTVTVVVQVTNSTGAPARAACRVQIAGTVRAKPPLLAGDLLRVYRFNSSELIGAGSAVTLTFKAAGAPIRLTPTGYPFLFSVRCWAR